MATSQQYNDFRNALTNIYSKSEAGNITDWVFEHITGKKSLKDLV